MVPKRFLIASLFIAAMILLVAYAMGPRAVSGGFTSGLPPAETINAFDTIAEFRLEDGWWLRFKDTKDPDQPTIWPYCGGFGAPWEPASPYLSDKGVALNGYQGQGLIALWRGLEWRRHRFEAPICSARLSPSAEYLLLTLAWGQERYETRLFDFPSLRPVWSVPSGPWSRFSWDGSAVLIGLHNPEEPNQLMLSSIPVNSAPSSNFSLALWDEKGLLPPPTGWIKEPDKLWESAKELPGARLVIPWDDGTKFWMPSKDRLWTSSKEHWYFWRLEHGIWKRADGGLGSLSAHPPKQMGLHTTIRGIKTRKLSPVSEPVWRELPLEPIWPETDPAWAWSADNSALTAWDLRWGNVPENLPKERNRTALENFYAIDWRSSITLRPALKAWLPNGPEVALREQQGTAWIWYGTRIALVRLPIDNRQRQIKEMLKYN